MKQCDGVNHCRFFYNNFTLDQLPQICDSSVTLSSPEGSDYRTMCVYKVNLTSSSNCSSLQLMHSVDHPQEEYVDSLNVSHPCRDAVNVSDNSISDCKDYVEILYENQSRVYCRSALAELDLSLRNVTSFVAVYWTDSTSDENFRGSFKIRAECTV